MADYYEYRRAGIPARHELLKTRANYHEFRDAHDRRYFIPKAEYAENARRDGIGANFERVYVLLRGQYNRDPDADAGQNEAYEMPPDGELVHLTLVGGTSSSDKKVAAIADNGYRFRFRVVGMISLFFPNGLPTCPAS